MKKTLHILLTSMGSTAAQNLAHVLRDDPRFFVVGADGQELHGGMDLTDVQIRLPMASDPDYAPALRAATDQHQIELLIPVMEPELRAADAARRQLEAEGVTVLLSSRRALEASSSKAELSSVFERFGMGTPELFVDREAIRYPAFARPDTGTGSKGTMLLRGESDLDHALSLQARTTITRLVEGPEFSVDGFADAEGNLIHAIFRRRIATKSGLAVRSIVVEPIRDLQPLRQLCRGLGLFGFFNLQFRRDVAGRELFFDLNPRLGGAMALSFEAGLDARGLLLGVMTGNWPEMPMGTAVGMQLLRRWHNVFLPSAE